MYFEARRVNILPWLWNKKSTCAPQRSDEHIWTAAPITTEGSHPTSKPASKKHCSLLSLEPSAILSTFPGSAFPTKSEHFKNVLPLRYTATFYGIKAFCSLWRTITTLHTEQNKSWFKMKSRAALTEAVFRFPEVSGEWFWRSARSTTTGKLQIHAKHNELDGLFKGCPNTIHQHVSASPVIPLTQQLNQMIPHVQQRGEKKGSITHMWSYKDISLFWLQNKHKLLNFRAHARSLC